MVFRIFRDLCSHRRVSSRIRSPFPRESPGRGGRHRRFPRPPPPPKQPGQDSLLPHISLFRAPDKPSPVARSSARLLGSPALSVRHRGAALAAPLLLWGLRATPWCEYTSLGLSQDIGGRSAFWRWGRTLLRPFPAGVWVHVCSPFPRAYPREQVEPLPAPLSRSCLTCPQRWPRLLARAGPHPFPCVSSLWLSSQVGRGVPQAFARRFRSARWG